MGRTVQLRSRSSATPFGVAGRPEKTTTATALIALSWAQFVRQFALEHLEMGLQQGQWCCGEGAPISAESLARAAVARHMAFADRTGASTSPALTMRAKIMRTAGIQEHSPRKRRLSPGDNILQSVPQWDQQGRDAGIYSIAGPLPEEHIFDEGCDHENEDDEPN